MHSLGPEWCLHTCFWLEGYKNGIVDLSLCELLAGEIDSSALEGSSEQPLVMRTRRGTPLGRLQLPGAKRKRSLSLEETSLVPPPPLAPVTEAAAGPPGEQSLVMKTRRGTSLGRTLPPPAKRALLEEGNLAPALGPAPGPCFASLDLDRVFLAVPQRRRGSRNAVSDVSVLVELVVDLVTCIRLLSAGSLVDGT
jgi:hypothetical protein